MDRKIVCCFRQILQPACTAALLALALVPWALDRFSVVIYVVSGRLLASPFDRVHVGGALDQPSLHKWFFIATFVTLVTLPWITTVRWASDRSTRCGYWSFFLPTAALCLCLLSVLTIPFWWVVQYIGVMGFTPKRIGGLLYAGCGYILISWYFLWAVRTPDANKKPQSQCICDG